MGLAQYWRNIFSERKLAKGSVDTKYALAEACLIGLISAGAALLLKDGIGWLGGYRLQLVNQFGHRTILPLMGLVCGFLAGWCLEVIAPAAAGGGIPQVKAVLGQFPMALSLRVAIAKTIGTVLVLGGGLTLGRRGPTVHIGAALAAEFSNWIPTSPQHRRQMIAAGAAAGLAAGFNTPIAGVLFVIEELMRDISNLTLETAILASFIGAVVSRLLGSADFNLDNTILKAQESSFTAPEIPFYLILGILAGVLGAFFNRGIMFSQGLYKQLNWPLSWKIGLSGLISGLIVSFLPPFFQNNAGLRDFLISSNLNWQTTALVFLAYLILTLLAYGSGAPGGLLAPALVLGSSLGYLVGTAETSLMGIPSIYTYTLAGMGAFFTGVVRVPVTAIVIVFEITTDFNLVLPLMIVSVIAYIVAEAIYPGSIYQHLLEAQGISLKEDGNKSDLLMKLTANDVMQTEIETLSSDLTLEELIKAMSLSNHRGFPVLENDELVGIITQSDLKNISNLAKDTPLKQLMTVQPITINPTAPLSDVLYLLNRYQLSRLPVTEGRRLLGIITRTDIIRAEVKQISGEIKHSWRPSYVVYQTCGPLLGKGRILVPLANPKTALKLLQIALQVAQYYNYEIECLQIISVSPDNSPEKTTVNLDKSKKLLDQVQNLETEYKIPIHTSIKVAYDPAEAILETVYDRHIDIIIMGCKGNYDPKGSIFGSLAEKVIKDAPATVLLIRLGNLPHSYPKLPRLHPRWLIPFVGGPNCERAIAFLPALVQLYQQNPEILLTQVQLKSQKEVNFSFLHDTSSQLSQQLKLPIIPIPIFANNVSEGIIKFAKRQKCELVILGTSSESFLKQAIYGNIPEMISRNLETTIILVRNKPD
jgi:CIC family chloride channel protein